jgi:hypothetical protein
LEDGSVFLRSKNPIVLKCSLSAEKLTQRHADTKEKERPSEITGLATSDRPVIKRQRFKVMDPDAQLRKWLMGCNGAGAQPCEVI